MSRMSFTVITPSYNQARFIERTIDSVLGQAGDFDLEYLVLDGGSTDGTREILARYGDRLIWESSPDRGQVDAINKGLRRARGEIVSWLNSDDLLAPGALARMAALFARHPSSEWAHGRCDIVDAEGREIRSWVSWYKDRCSRHYSYSRLLMENFISQMTVFWRRSAIGQIGLLDPSLQLAFDYDYWLRLARRGDPIYIPERVASFRWYETSKSGTRFDEQFREDYAVALRHAPHRSWILWRKRWKTARTILIYRGLQWFRPAAPDSAKVN